MTADQPPSRMLLKPTRLTWESSMLWNKNKSRRKRWNRHDIPSGETVYKPQARKYFMELSKRLLSWGPRWDRMGGQELHFTGWVSICLFRTQCQPGNENPCSCICCLHQAVQKPLSCHSTSMCVALWLCSGKPPYPGCSLGHDSKLSSSSPSYLFNRVQGV